MTACQMLCQCQHQLYTLQRFAIPLTVHPHLLLLVPHENNVEHVWRKLQLCLWWNFQLECDHEYDISHKALR